FQLLEKLDVGAGEPDVRELNKQVEGLFALPDVAADEKLQLMTIHKAKGLEFDTVILPGLGRRPRNDETRLLHWLEQGLASGGSDLLLAPVGALGEDRNPMAAYLQKLDKDRRLLEDGRLLYVAVTRARQRLHLLGQIDVNLDKVGVSALKEPAKDTLLARLWPVLAEEFDTVWHQYHENRENKASEAHDVEESQPKQAEMRQRLALDWTLPPLPEPVLSGAGVDGMSGIIESAAETPERESVDYDWAGETARHVGTVVHRLYQHIARTGVERLAPSGVDTMVQFGHNMLVRLGVPESRLINAGEEIRQAMEAALTDERGRWLLSHQHEEAQSELALSQATRKGVIHRIMDRTFVDESGIRWIIDYKTGTHTGGGREEFLDREQARYRQQLEAYARMMRLLDQRPIRLGLYFPMVRGWREWDYP
ncbi:MAG: PD-(D/E)XK nuclease family protein, partial [Gammaproteobacteria bacterium]|nr:PD-(D/E)XK nuclease family protein [Gammaproteobacteria bacterium]